MVAACVAALGASGLADMDKGGFPERFPDLPGIDLRKSVRHGSTQFLGYQSMKVLQRDGIVILDWSGASASTRWR